MKNLTIFSKHFWPENFKINDIAFKLRKKITVNVFTSEPNYNNFKYKHKKKEAIYKGVKIRYFKTFKKTKDNFTNIFLDYFTYIINLTLKINFFLKEKSDITLTFATSPIFQAIPAIYFSKLKKIPSIIWVQDLWPEVLEDTGYVKNKIILNLINRLVNIIYNSSDFILVQSDSFKKHLLKNYDLKDKVLTLHQPSEFKFQKIDKKKKKIFYITYAGNFGKAQNFDTIIDAFKSEKLNKEVKMILIGSGKKFEHIKNEIKLNNLKDKIILQKYVNKKKLLKIYKLSSAFFLSLNDGKSLNKTIPGKFQTYLAFGKPIIVNSNSDINKFIIKNTLGFVSKNKDSKKLIIDINKVSKLSENKKKKIYLSSKKVYEENFNINDISNKLIKILEKVQSKYAKETIL
jgi:glycosyltransferase involved in cell wall biosynthesis